MYAGPLRAKTFGKPNCEWRAEAGDPATQPGERGYWLAMRWETASRQSSALSRSVS